MRNTVVVAILIYCIAASVFNASAAKVELPKTTLFGREYVNLADYAKRRNLQLQWTRPNEEVKLKSKWSELVFTVDSQKALINGVVVWLCFPIAKKNNELFISPIDVNAAVEPIINPPRAKLFEKVRTVFLDPGHGGKDPGNKEGNHLEKEYTLMLAYEIKRQLENAGFNVIMSRTRDTFLELEERADLARRHGAQLFVSIHFNSADNAGVNGVETYCMTPAGADSTNARSSNANKATTPGNRNDERNMFLAWNIQKSLVNSIKSDDRGVKRARFSVLRNATMPAVLVEFGFMSSKEDMRKIMDVAWRKQMARGVVEGIKTYKKQLER